MRTTDDLREGISHVEYEVEMLNEALRAYEATPNRRVPAAFLLLEAALLHVRNLYSFFCDPAKYPDDVVAGDFVPAWDLKIACESLKSIDVGRIHKALAHVTYHRTALRDAPAWNLFAMASELIKVFDSFNHAKRNSQLSQPPQLIVRPQIHLPDARLTGSTGSTGPTEINRFS